MSVEHSSHCYPPGRIAPLPPIPDGSVQVDSAFPALCHDQIFLTLKRTKTATSAAVRLINDMQFFCIFGKTINLLLLATALG